MRPPECEQDLQLPRLAITQDQKASGGHALGQHVTAQGGEDGFSWSGHFLFRTLTFAHWSLGARVLTHLI